MDGDAVARLYDSFVKQEPSSAISVIDAAKRAGVSQDQLFDQLFVPAVAMLGEAWAKGEVDEMTFTQAAVVAEQLTSFVTPPLTAPATGMTVVIGCGLHEHHDVAKNVIASALKQAGHRVVDLGVDVRSADFLEKAVESAASVVIVCAEMMQTAKNAERVRDVLDNAGREDCVLLVAGGPFEADESLARELGANGIVRGAASGLRLVDRIMHDRTSGKGA